MTVEDAHSGTRQVQSLVGQSLSQLCLGPGDAQLRFSSGVTVTFENPITVAAGGSVVPYALEGVALLLPLFNGEVSDVAVEDDGVLSLVIAGTTLRCRPDPDYEAWQVTGRDVGLVVCTPGGGLAIWHP